MAKKKVATQSAERASARSPEPTHCAVLTAAGRSAVAVVGLRGPSASRQLAKCFEPASKQPFFAGEIRFGVWGLADDDKPTEAVVVTPIDTDVFEIHCHGGPAAISRIVDDLKQSGATPVEADIWSSSTDAPLVITEAHQVLQACQTPRTAAIALDQMRGAMVTWAAQLKERIAQTDHDKPAIPDALRDEISRLVRNADLGTRLARSQQVVLTGPPNVGKSSLLNAIVGYDRSITWDTAGTTRDVLHADTVIDGIPIRLSDTAGIRETDEPVERDGVVRARAAAEDADLVICVGQPGQAWPTQPANKRTIPVLNKADLLDGSDDLPDHLPDQTIRSVAITGQGVESLMQAVVAGLFLKFPEPGEPVPLNQRQANCLQNMLEAETLAEINVLAEQLIVGN